MNESNEFIPTRLTLLSRLKDLNDQESWREFFETYWKLIYNTGIRSGLNDAEAQDLVQETIISVTRNIGKYDASRGSFKQWLLKVTQWRIVDQLRKRPPIGAIIERRADETTRTSAIERIADPAAEALHSFWDEEWEKNIVNFAIERVKQKVDPKHFQVFDLATWKGWSSSQIADKLKLSLARIYLIKHRVAKAIKKEVRHLQKKLESQ